MKGGLTIMLLIFATIIFFLYFYTLVLVSKADREIAVSMMSAGVVYAGLYFELVRRVVFYYLKEN